jgi:hypothetical protein
MIKMFDKSMIKDYFIVGGRGSDRYFYLQLVNGKWYCSKDGGDWLEATGGRERVERTLGRIYYIPTIHLSKVVGDFVTCAAKKNPEWLEIRR